MVSKIRPDSRYVWFNTGMEYKATKEHLEYIENRYGIKIERIRAKFPVPLAVRKFGYPFLSKIFRNTYQGFKYITLIGLTDLLRNLSKNIRGAGLLSDGGATRRVKILAST